MPVPVLELLILDYLSIKADTIIFPPSVLFDALNFIAPA